ncbi:heterodisulfide reductase-related iron-sulfur binding cluster [Propionivibrio dicarboxylicus]|uniref:Glycerol-3-phosphate dehydrogenase subunit C n=1 Tax=Propionivibrio dicarboxylicus TaxID=83767 RepID=A0A1G7VB50_9RHOO|nr:heterodisulfide reductase-related iron-sulfur binding cluster [Propionivibrio dicarboxylicus]SDG56569.1 glycerol-3-phosphate dehydrogenase subunit C [Propionivibrio dicarboxylicus]
MPEIPPEQFVRQTIDRCTACDWCREYLEESTCLFFHRLFRLHDRRTAGGAAITDTEMEQLPDLCNHCGLCPCIDIRTLIRQAKDGFAKRRGVPITVRALEDLRLLSRTAGAVPRIANALLQHRQIGPGLKRLAGIHPDRKLPSFPRQSFDVWVRARKLDQPTPTDGRKVAYFVGCTARYLFPEVARATVEVLERNGVSVYVPPQRCCSMPSLLEGDRAFTLKNARFNLESLAQGVDAGYDIICSCPTCGYFLKSVQPAEAVYSPEYRARIAPIAAEEGNNLERIGRRLRAEDPLLGQRQDTLIQRASKPMTLKFVLAGLLRDRGYFAEFDGIQRLKIASRTYDLGEYLRELDTQRQFDRRFTPASPSLAYFSPCHQREQEIGTPWLDVLAGVPGIDLQRFGDTLDCCGLGGLMGYKTAFHATSAAIGGRLARKAQATGAEELVTDCLSCRMQFNQLLPQRVSHPVELLAAAYRAADNDAVSGGEP